MSDFDESEFDDSDEESELQELQQLDAAISEIGNDDEQPSTSASMWHEPMPSTSRATTTISYSEYSKIEAAIALNKICDERLRKLESALQLRLAECNRRLTAIEEAESGAADKRGKNDKDKGKFSYVHFGKPYFKDKRGFTPPDNEDIVLMKQMGMYDFSTIASVPTWTFKDKRKLCNAIHKMSQEIKKKELDSQILALQRETKILKSNKNNDKISKLKREIADISKQPLAKLVLPIDKEYDWDAIAYKLGNRHNANEYRSLWKQFLHPSINTNIWNKSEHYSLQKIAFENQLQDWDAIAKELNTKRTTYQCFVYFRTSVTNTFTSRKWTKEEEEYLMRIIEYYKEDNYIPWGKVAAAMENRTKIQVYNKYARLTELRKGKFLPEEDSVILTCINIYGPNFRKVTEYLHGRSVTQCRERHHILAKRQYSTVWTVDEDRKLVQMMTNQNGNTNFANVTEYFPGKDRVNIRSRYLTLSKWMQRNPNVDVRHAPRRGARRLIHGKSTQDLNRAIENLKKRLESEVIDKKKSKLTKDSPEDVIDAAIVAVIATNLLNNQKNEQALSEAPQQELEQEGSYVIIGENKFYDITVLRKLLILMKAKLNRRNFANSPVRNTYQGLLDTENVSGTLQVKSYSRKQVVKKIEIKKKVDIWGNPLTGQLSYILPPHYTTITGCKQLMSLYMDSQANSDDTNSILLRIRKNRMAKEQVAILSERYFSLFLWPVQLSNASPKDFMPNPESPVPFTSKPVKRFVVFQKEDYNLVLPRADTSEKIKEIDDSIDLKETKDCSKIDIDETYFDSIADIKL